MKEKSCLNCVNSWRNSGEVKGCMKDECDNFSHWELANMKRSCKNCNRYPTCGENKEYCNGNGFVYWELIRNNRNIYPKECENDHKLPELFKVLTSKYNLAVDKNTDYGNSFDKIMDKLVEHKIDPLQGLYIRLADKFNRFETLLFSDTQKVKDESIRDTLRDLSNYVDLYMAWEASRDGK